MCLFPVANYCCWKWRTFACVWDKMSGWWRRPTVYDQHRGFLCFIKIFSFLNSGRVKTNTVYKSTCMY